MKCDESQHMTSSESTDASAATGIESETMPEHGSSATLTRCHGDPAKRIPRVDPMILWGTWPGDEPSEDLLAALD